MLPRVLKAAMPLRGAVQLTQTELPPFLPACIGSSGSAVAAKLSPIRTPKAVVIELRSSKLSAKTRAEPLITTSAISLLMAPNRLATTTW